MGVGLVSSFVGAKAGRWAVNKLDAFVINGINSPILKGTLSGSFSGAIGGYAAGFTAGLILSKGNIKAADKAGLNGATTGAWSGAISGLGSSYAEAKEAHINPWNGRLQWPSNGGFEGIPQPTVLPEGSIITRYGNNNGVYASPEGVDFQSRSLPNRALKSPYSVFEVKNPISAFEGKVAPWFKQPGGGIQYRLKTL